MGETLKNLVTCRPLLAIIVVALLTLVASLGSQAMNSLLYKDYFNCLFFLYPLGKKQVDENNRILAERRAAR